MDTDKITQFIGGDNLAIGRAAGEYAVKLLGGPGNAKGNIVEIWGGMASQPAHDRHNGFAEIVGKESGIKSILKPIDTEWKEKKGYDLMQTVRTATESIQSCVRS